MRKRKLEITRTVTDNVMPLKEQWQDLSALEPDDLRSQVQRAFSTLCEADCKALCPRLLTGLAKAGVHVGASLFMLGIPVDGLNNLTPSDMGKLLRYIRINTPTAINALTEPLAELFGAKEGLMFTAQKIDEAV